ncbi:MAG TPA: non-homologous end-joining DNA ligase [Candidatus Acidoferrales bacterium]|nr:non-homologous end-joining DNA ligase [Candidatus Acidoferrales bacterium]
MASKRSDLRVDGRTLSVSNLDKVLFPRDGYTKGDLIDYYRAVAATILPHLERRPLTLQRYPDGIGKESFFEKHVPKGIPDWVHTTTLDSPEGRRERTTYIVCDDEPSLVYIANLASIVLHVWTSRVGAIEHPDFVFFDLDPGEKCTIKTMAQTALALRDVLAAVKIKPLVKTSGGMGLHVAIPLADGYSYDAVKVFTEAVARHLTKAQPELVTLERTIARRDEHLVYLDYVQVGRGKTMVAPYSVRARDRAPVSTPLDWSEVEAFARKRTGVPSEVFAAFTMRTTAKRIAREGDLWGSKAWRPQHLPAS